jgi:type IX secretion system substrate protein
MIYGAYFDGTTQVSFGGVPASYFSVWGSGQLIAVVGAGATGAISVTTSAGTGSKGGFTYIPPTITSFTPVSAAPGTTVTINGVSLLGATAVSFGGVAASSFTVVNGTKITAVVGPGASGDVVVTTPSGSATLAGFTYLGPPPPTITSFTPTSGTNGTAVTITGTGFGGATAVNFGGTAATSFSIINLTSISAVVGSGATGNVTVTTPNGTASLAGFTYNTVTAVGGNPANNNTKDLQAFPNPGDDQVLIKHPASTKKATIRFVDMLGRDVKLVIPARNSSQTTTSVKELQAGIYRIMWSDGGIILTRTFMVN